jgi:MFS superfamily sulfate permease-like transporter
MANGSHWGADFLASFVVFLVALPLCMGISIASGLPPTAGIITGIIGGIVVGLLAGSPLQASGPAAGLSVLVFNLVEAHGLVLVGVIVMFAGVLQMIAAGLKLGQWFRAVSPAVIHGMLAGIGILILVAQFHVMFDGKPIGTGIQNLLAMPKTLLDAIQAKDSRLTAGLLGLLTIGTIFGWGALAPKSWRILPAPLVGVIVAMAVAAVFHLTQIKYIDVPSNIWAETKFPTLQTLLQIANPAILIGAISVALIASAETLLCATAVDQMHSGERTDYNKELFAQGVGNTLCGVLGVLPLTGVIVRSSANVEAGAKTRYSTILHGIWLLLFASALPFTLKYVPISALAGLLVFTGYKLAYPKIVPTLLKYSRAEVVIYFATIATIVGTDLLKGVVLGLVLSLAKLLYDFSHLVIRRVDNAADKTVEIHLAGAATLIRLPELAGVLEKLDAGSHVQVFIDDLNYIDHACIDLLTNWDRQHKATGGALTINWEGLTNRYKTGGSSQDGRAPTSA